MRKIESSKTDGADRPVKDIVITKSGLLEMGAPFEVERTASEE